MAFETNVKRLYKMDKIPHLIQLADEALRINRLRQTKSRTQVINLILDFPAEWPGCAEHAELDNLRLHSTPALRLTMTVGMLDSGDPSYAYSIATAKDGRKVVFTHDRKAHAPTMASKRDTALLLSQGYLPVQVSTPEGGWRMTNIPELEGVEYMEMIHFHVRESFHEDDADDNGEEQVYRTVRVEERRVG